MKLFFFFVPAEQQALQRHDLSLQLSHCLVVQDAAGWRRSLQESHKSDTHTHKHTPAQSQYVPFNRSSVLNSAIRNNKNSFVKEKKHKGCKVNKYGECKCQKPHVFVSQIIRHHNNLTTACCRRRQSAGQPAAATFGPLTALKVLSRCFYIIFLTI